MEQTMVFRPACAAAVGSVVLGCPCIYEFWSAVSASWGKSGGNHITRALPSQDLLSEHSKVAGSQQIHGLWQVCCEGQTHVLWESTNGTGLTLAGEKEAPSSEGAWKLRSIRAVEVSWWQWEKEGQDREWEKRSKQKEHQRQRAETGKNTVPLGKDRRPVFPEDREYEGEVQDGAEKLAVVQGCRAL